jgi:single-strand DNA-binding protein
MSDINSVNFTARLTRDPELRSTRSEHSVTTLRVAIGRPKSRDGEDRGAVFYSVEVWNGAAENCVRFLSKGSRIAVNGRLDHDQWKDEHDVPHERSYVVAHQVTFLDPPPKAGDSGTSAGDGTPAAGEAPTEREPDAAAQGADDIPV